MGPAHGQALEARFRLQVPWLDAPAGVEPLQHPNDLGVGELVDLLASRFVFRQAPGAAERALISGTGR